MFSIKATTHGAPRHSEAATGNLTRWDSALHLQVGLGPPERLTKAESALIDRA